MTSELEPIHPEVTAALEPLQDFYEDRRVLVTGGLGFIGSAVVHQLAQLGADVLNLDKGTYAAHPANLDDLPEDANVRSIRVDVANASAVRAAWQAHEPEVALHLAAESHVDRSIEDASPFMRTNVEGTQVLLDQLRSSSDADLEAFVHVSTDEVYGDVPMDAEPLDESAPFRASSPYAASKAAADLLAQSYIRTYGAPVAITRGSNTYGPRQFPEKLIPVMLTKMRKGEPLPVYGDGMQRRDWMYVDDHARAILSIPPRYPQLKGPSQDPHEWAGFNVGFEQDLPNLGLLDRLMETYSVEVPGSPGKEELEATITHVEDRAGHDRRYAMDTKDTKQRLGWEPVVDLASGLRRTVCWYRDNRAWAEAVLQGSYQDTIDRVLTPLEGATAEVA